MKTWLPLHKYLPTTSWVAKIESAQDTLFLYAADWGGELMLLGIPSEVSQEPRIPAPLVTTEDKVTPL